MTIQKQPNSPHNNNVISSAKTELRSDINALKQDLSSLSQHAIAAGAEGAAQLRQQAGDSYDQLKSASLRNMERLETRIREKPAQSMAIAFAVGAVVSMLFGSRNR